MRKKSTLDRLGLHIMRYIAFGTILAFCPVMARAEPGADTLPTVECQGNVQPCHEWTLRLRPGERLLNVRVAEGALVKAGAPVAEICDGEAWMRLAELQSQQQARFALKSKKARLKRMEAELAAELQLWKQVEPHSAERRVAGLRGQVDDLKEQVALLQVQVAGPTGTNQVEQSLAAAEDAEIRDLKAQLASPVVHAPFAGRVVDCAAYPDRLSAGDTVLKVWDTNVMVRAEVLQHQLAYVTKGCHAEVLLDFSKEPPLRATVRQIEIEPDVKPGEMYPLFGVDLRLDHTPVWLKPGMRVSVRIHPMNPPTRTTRP